MYVQVPILVLLQNGNLITPGIVAVHAWRVSSVLCLTNMICTITGQNRQPLICSVYFIVHISN